MPPQLYKTTIPKKNTTMNTTYNTSNKNVNDYIIYLNSARDGYKLKTRDGVEIMQVTGSTLFKDLTPAPEEVTTATTEEEQPTSKPAPTPEATTTPEEVQPATTDVTTTAPDLPDLSAGTKALKRTVFEGCRRVIRYYPDSRWGSHKAEEYTLNEHGNKHGLYRSYCSNGKRKVFAVYDNGTIIEQRKYGKSNKEYRLDNRTDNFKLRIESSGAITLEYHGQVYQWGADDDNRPEAPEDYPNLVLETNDFLQRSLARSPLAFRTGQAFAIPSTYDDYERLKQAEEASKKSKENRA